MVCDSLINRKVVLMSVLGHSPRCHEVLKLPNYLIIMSGGTTGYYTALGIKLRKETADWSDRVASGSALSLTRLPQQAVVLQQLSVEGAHLAADEGMQTLPQQQQAPGRLQPVLVLPVVETGRQFLKHRVRMESRRKTQVEKTRKSWQFGPALSMQAAERPLDGAVGFGNVTVQLFAAPGEG